MPRKGSSLKYWNNNNHGVGQEAGNGDVAVSVRKSLRLERHALAFFGRSRLCGPLALAVSLAATLFGPDWEHEEFRAGDAPAPQ